MIEVVHSVLGDKKQATTFNELVQEIAQVLGLSQEQVNAKNRTILYRLKH